MIIIEIVVVVTIIGVIVETEGHHTDTKLLQCKYYSTVNIVYILL